jgi:hypothetical protein
MKISEHKLYKSLLFTCLIVIIGLKTASLI